MEQEVKAIEIFSELTKAQDAYWRMMVFRSFTRSHRRNQQKTRKCARRNGRY